MIAQVPKLPWLAELGLLSLTDLQKLQNQNQPQLLNPRLLAAAPPKPWMWNHTEAQAQAAHQEPEDDSWEVRAFAEDTGSVMGTTWPPRSYTCTFCRREFRSAQALGGHMNVHRRDRARLHQSHPPINPAAASLVSSSSTSSFIIPTHQEFIDANGGLCLVYQLANPSAVNGAATFVSSSTTRGTGGLEASSPSTFLSISSSFPAHDYLAVPVGPPNSNSEYCQQQPSSTSMSRTENGNAEELDLELRLGHGRPTLPS